MGTNIFTAMNSIAVEYKAINLAQGFPNFDTPAELVDLVTRAFREGKNQYAPMPGVPELREAIAEKIEFIYGRRYDPVTEITITPGGHLALTAAATAVLQAGDEVIIFEPSFDCFAPIVQLCGATPIFVKLRFPDYSVDWNEVKSRISSRTKLIWINTPHNPTGTVLSAADMDSLTEITRGTGIVVLSDEVYEHLVFDQESHQSVFRHPELAERSFSIYSFGKVYHATGWKVGYCVAPKYLMDEFRKIYQMICFTVNHPVQCGLAAFLRKRDHYQALGKFYQQKRDFFVERLAGSRFDCTPAKGSYFQCLTYKRIGAEAEMDMAVRLAREARVASIPLSSFYHDKTDHGVLRFCFAKTNDVLEEAAASLCKI